MQTGEIPQAEDLPISAAQQARALASSRTSASTLAQMALARARRGEGPRAFIHTYDGWAQELAAASDQRRGAGSVRSALDGLPLSIQDVFDVCGEVTRAGSRVLRRAAPATRHATVVQRLLDAGAVLVGRSNMSEFAFSSLGLNPHYGTPANPWQRLERRIPGGAASGAAVSVSDGMCAAAVAGDTGGAVRIAAALCGLVGFKPTAARVPRFGMWPLSRALDSVGVIAHDVSSCLLLDGGMAEQPLACGTQRDVARAHFAVPRTVVLDGVDAVVAQTFEAALRALGQRGAKITQLDMPEFAEWSGIHIAGELTVIEAWARHEALLQTRAEAFDPHVLAHLRRGQGVLARDLVRLQERRLHWQQAVRGRMAAYDALLMPTVPHIAPRMVDLEGSAQAWDAAHAAMQRNPALINFLDGCAFSLPCQLPQRAPVGLTVAGGCMQDAEVAAWALAIEGVLRGRHD